MLTLPLYRGRDEHLTTTTMQATDPAFRYKAVTPSDTAPVTYTEQSITGDPKSPKVLDRCRGLFVGGAGNLSVKDDAGNTVVFTGVLAGSILPISVRLVLSATTATNIVALF